MHLVIGSGPAGVACAHALLARGETVRMLDGGVQLEPWRAARAEAMGSKTPAEWSREELEFIREGTSSGTGGVPLKRLFGSDFPYQEAASRLHIALAGVGVKPSLARGGFSNVWGAAMLPYLDADLVDWPFGAPRLEKHYRAVTAITGLSAVEDDLAEWFPVYAEQPSELNLSRQAQRLLGHLRAHREELRAAGISFGRSRLAVRGSAGPDRPGCVYCGLCMYGCPYGMIYNSLSTVEELKGSPGFSYQPGFLVDSVRESATSATVLGRDRSSGQSSTLVGDRVFLAGGSLPSTQILLRSLGAFGRAVHMMDSQYYLIPLLLMKGERDVREESLHTLSQLYLEMRDRSISPYTVHLQAYTYNDLMGQAMRKAFGPLGTVLDPVVRAMEGRLLVLQGYLHSAHSGTIRVELTRTTPGPEPTLEVTGEPRPVTKLVVRRVLGKLLRQTRHLGAAPLLPLTKIAEPGRGFHTGGTFPMRVKPGSFESDELGRPAGWHRVHVVDATVLPSIPATTITFTVMANAHRIGWESADL